ncbi:MAG: nuclease, partial [Bacteroidaceae bacterium]|nr:nuclease [Bacteroidaceae bacterium]
GSTVIKHSTRSDRSIQYNASSPRFACYKSAQRPVSLYVRSDATGGVALPFVKTDKVNVCTLDGRVVRCGVPAATALVGLPSGLYIVGGTKVIVR